MSSVEQTTATEVTASELDAEHRRQVFRWAASQAAVRFSETTWMAFSETAIRGKRVREVASHLGISEGAVYTARSRVMQCLQQYVQEYDDADV